ncbi:hypothetical protein AAFF_G00290740 [Aldrovandia affinis]|uniref:Helitron helicase-like domain-containing protein n=1 Tax=Aldrovandia affinis TaxID=143900 RepID=A0AAD7W1K5_9TELE|nr:hypothetical protein AAFF_G00290740 [Aldrovandia affinis]
METAADATDERRLSDADKEKEDLRPGLALDTCMQPPDRKEVLSYGDGIFSVAPTQGNKPVGFFSTPKLEAMAFPVQFPTGRNTLDEPIGPVEDYLFRVEFQARGSPHIHMVVWIEDAPGVQDPEDCPDVIKFINRYITCQMPDEKADPELHKIVSEVQVHSRNHSKTCRKGNVSCRFGFPRLPMDKTIITSAPWNDDKDDGQNKKCGGKAKDVEEKDDVQEKECGKKDSKKSKKSKKFIGKKQREAKEKLKPVRDFLMDANASFKDV